MSATTAPKAKTKAPEIKPHKKYVAVLVHADMWGAYNANMLVRAVKAHGAEPILIVSRSTAGEDGKPITKVSELIPSRVLKEKSMLKFFDGIDQEARKVKRQNKLEKLKGKSSDQPETDRFLTFRQLADTFCPDHTAHFTSTGGPKGGDEILAIIDGLKKEKGITPEVVLSGDTLAILPAAITDNYDCFGTHPGPLPYIKGMQGTERSLVNNMMYDEAGYLQRSMRYPDQNYFVKGCFFNLATKLDEGPIIAEGYGLAEPAIDFYDAGPRPKRPDLLEVRQNLYTGLVMQMIKHLPQLLEKKSRKELIAAAKKNASIHLSNAHDEGFEIGNLTSDELVKWHGDGVAHVNYGHGGGPVDWTEVMEPSPNHSIDIQQNLIVDPEYFKKCMADFFPDAYRISRDGKPAYSPEFEKKFEAAFRPDLNFIMSQANASKGKDILEMEMIQRELRDGTYSDERTPEEHEMNELLNKVNRTTGKIYPVKVRHVWSDGTMHRTREPGTEPKGRAK